MLSDASVILLGGACFLIAALYAAAGFGGGSSFLALLSLYLKEFAGIRTMGLLCNLVVVSGGSWLFGRNGYLDRKGFLPLAAGGVPLAFFGATIRLDESSFFISLGAVLCLSALLLIIQVALDKADEGVRLRPSPWPLRLLLGGCIGFVSGLTGIGGGILLSPVMHLLRWDSSKRIAATASLFILVNSLAGLAGQIAGGTFQLIMPLAAVLLPAVFLGGQLGTRLSIHAIRPGAVKGLTAVLVGYIGLRLVLNYANGIDI